MGNRDWINEERLGIIEHGVAENRVMINKVQEKLSGLGPDGSDDNWRCMFVHELSNVTVTAGDPHTAPTHSQEQTCVDVVDVEAFYP